MTRQDFRLLTSPVSLATPMLPVHPAKRAVPKVSLRRPLRRPARRAD